MSDDKNAGKRQLGRGLSALLGGDDGEHAAGRGGAGQRAQRADRVPDPGPIPAAPHFDDEEIAAAGASRSASKGVLQPILVRAASQRTTANSRSSPASGAGARRSWRSCTKCRWCVRELGDREALEIALVENMQRQDLNPIEEARGYRRLMAGIRPHPGRCSRSASARAASHIANTLRLLRAAGQSCAA